MYKYGFRDRFSFFVDDCYETPESPETGSNNPSPFQNSPSPLREKCRLIMAHGLLYVLRGSFEVRVEGSRYVLTPGDLFLVRESEGHTIDALTYPCECFDSSFSLHYVRIPDPEGRLFRPFVEREPGVGNVIAAEHLDHELIRTACGHIAQTEDAYMRRIAVFGALQLVFTEIARAYRPEHLKAPEERDPYAVEILQYINENLSSPEMDPVTLAQHFYVSRSQLNRIIKSATGFTLWNYITCKRLARAYYLAQSGVSNKDAARISGFQDYSTFYKAYTRLRGISPKDDRPSESFDPLLTHFYQPDTGAMML